VTSPNIPRIDRASLDRIIQRAAELQTGDREVGDNLSADEVMALGKEVGIPSRYLQQAILEHQTTVAAAPDTTAMGRLIGPGEVQSQRVVQGSAAEVLRALAEWMEKNELLVVQRQQVGWISWEPLRGMQAAIRRGAASLDTSKPKFMLSRAELVLATVTDLEGGYCHVSLTATLKGVRRDHVIGSVVSAGLGLGLTAALATLGVFIPVAVVPLGASLLISGTVIRSFRPIPNRVQMGLDRALDYLERGGAKTKELPDRGPGLLDVLANEVRRALGPGKDK
jgi:hypothetical protein